MKSRQNRVLKKYKKLPDVIHGASFRELLLYRIVPSPGVANTAAKNEEGQPSSRIELQL